MTPSDQRDPERETAREAGVPRATDETVPDTRVATGDRRDEVRLEPDVNQLVRMRATFKPQAPLPPEDPAGPAEGAGRAPGPPVEDVAVAPTGPSVWDARPKDDDGGG